MSDVYEITHGLDRLNPLDALDTPAGDYVFNFEKAAQGLDLNTAVDPANYKAVTGRDLATVLGYHDSNKSNAENDWDGDGVSNVDEVLTFHTDPGDAASQPTLQTLYQTILAGSENVSLTTLLHYAWLVPYYSNPNGNQPTGQPVLAGADPWTAGGASGGSGALKAGYEAFDQTGPPTPDNDQHHDTFPTFHVEAASNEVTQSIHYDSDGSSVLWEDDPQFYPLDWHWANAQNSRKSLVRNPEVTEETDPGYQCSDCMSSGTHCDPYTCCCGGFGQCNCKDPTPVLVVRWRDDSDELNGRMRIIFDEPTPCDSITYWVWTYSNGIYTYSQVNEIPVPQGATGLDAFNISCSDDETVWVEFDHIAYPDLGGDDDGPQGTNPQAAFAGSFTDSAGPKFRRIGMDGKPMRDAFPDPGDEYKQPQSVTAVDGLTGQLRLSMTDAQVRRAPGTHIELAARRDYAEETWGTLSGVRLGERPDRPFGAGFTSNICASLTLEKISYTTQPDPSDPASIYHRQRFTVTLVDDQGCVQRFKAVNQQWVRIKEERSDVVTANNVLTSLWDGDGNPLSFELTKGLGGKCVYEMTLLQGQTFGTTRDTGDVTHPAKGNQVDMSYGRLTWASDRRNQVLTYAYGSDYSLTAKSITEQMGGGVLNISLDGEGLVQSVSSSNDSTTTFTYQTVGGYKALASSTKDGQTYSYTFAADDEPDPSPIVDPNDPNAPTEVMHHIYLTGVTEPGNKVYTFQSELDQNHSYQQSYYQDHSLYFMYRTQLGMPHRVTSVTGPGGMWATIHCSYASAVDVNGLFTADAGTTVQGSAGDFGFSFANLRSEIVPSDSDDLLDLNYSTTVTACFTSMNITSAAGTMSFQFDYDLGLPLTRFTDLNGHETNWTYVLGFEYPTSQTNPLGGIQTYTYDEHEDMAYLWDERGVTKEYIRDPSSGLPLWVNVYAPDGTPVFQRQVTYGTTATTANYANMECIRALHPEFGEHDLVMVVDRDDRGNVTREVLDPGGLNLQTLYDYSDRDLLLRTVDPLGNTTRHAYNLRGDRILTVWPDGSNHSWAYDDRGNLTSETDEMGTVTDYTYDDLDEKLSATVHLNDGNPTHDLVHSWTYTAMHEVETETDPNGNVVTHTYDAEGRGWLASSQLGTEVTHFAYGFNSARTIWDDPKPVLVTDPRGVTSAHAYDPLRREVSTTVTDGGTTSTHYDAVGNPDSMTDPLGRVTTTQYDAMSRPVLVTYPDGLFKQMDYDSQGKPLRVVDELARQTWTQYDPAGRPSQVIAPEVMMPGGAMAHPAVTTYYDAASHPVAVQDALGRVTNTDYDSRGRPIKVTSPLAWDVATQSMRRAEVSTTYDALGRVTSVTDAYGKVTTKVYDRASRLLETHLPAVSINGATPEQETMVRSEYDKNGNVLHAFDAANHQTTNEYDAHNRLITTTDAEGQVTHFTYDGSGNRDSVTDGNGNTTTWAYDGRNRVLTETPPGSGAIITNTYDALNKISSTDALQRTITFDYDLRNRLLDMVEPGNTRSYNYDDGGRLLSVTETADATATVSYAYDALDRVLSETSRGLTHSYSYDLAGNRVGATYATGRQVATTYDGLNHPIAMQDGTRQTQWGYDIGGRCVAQQEANGTFVYNTYDAQGRLTARSQQHGLITLATFSWQHDAVGNVTRQEENFGSGPRVTQMAYDNTSRLLTETVTTGSDVDESAYTYDPASNRTALLKTHNALLQTSTSYTYNALNQLTAWEETNSSNVTRSATLTYDAVGNRSGLTLSSGGSDLHTTYTWDVLNRLTGVMRTDGLSGSYAYDYRTRRITRTEQGYSTTALSFSGGLSAAEYPITNPQSAIPNPQSAAVEYQRGPDLGGGVGGLLYSLRAGLARFNLSNARGDVVMQTDSLGSLTWRASYEAYGKRPVETGTNLDRQRANTKEEDPTGLLNEGFRYRDLETGVWLSRDPAGFVDGPNLYAYVRQNPWTYFDAEGLSFWTKLGKLVLKGGDIGLTVAGFVDDYHTFTNPNSTFGERFGASWSMLSEVLPVSVDDIKGGYKMSKKLLHGAEETKDLANDAKKIEKETKNFEKQKEQAEKLAKELEARKQKALTESEKKRPGSKGHPDHQEKVSELEAKARAEAGPGETVFRERQLQGHDSTRIPDVQIVNEEGKARKVFEAERRPNSDRNLKREAEYNKLKIEHETHPVK